MTVDVSTSRPTDSETTLPAPSRSAVLSFGDYDVIGELGEGGMGRVYKAVDRNLGRFVAVKVLRSTDPFECSRFRGEAELIAALEHPNIVKIFAVDTAPDGRPYIVLEFAEGGSLDRELAGQPQEPRRAAEMIEALARAVHFAHEKGVIHRDLKPANVLRGKDRVLKLTDFGLAKEMEVSSGMTPSNAVLGTPSYMSPEQAEGKVKQLGPPADVYGLGAILYEMLTGRPPFRGVNVVDTLEQVRWAEPAPPSRLAPRLPRDLSTICPKCLHKSPARRYQTAAELADDLRRWQNGETIAARPAPTWERVVRQVRRRPWEAAAMTASALLVVLLLIGWAFIERKAAQDRTRDERAAIEKRLRDEKEEGDRKLREEREQGAREREREVVGEKELAKRQAQDALTALNEIRELILVGELSHQPRLEPLYARLGDFYKKLLEQRNSRFDKVELADGLVKVGDLYRRIGKDDEALDAYASAAERCRPLAADEPKARAVLADALLRRGQVAFDRGDDKAAEDACAEVGRLLDPAALPPGHPLSGQVAELFHLRGQLLGRKGALDDAEAAYQESIRYREHLARSFAGDLAALPEADRKRARAALTDLGRGYGYLGDVLLDAGRFSDAEAAYWTSHDARVRVVDSFTARDKAGEARDARHQLARSWSNLATLHTRSRTLGTARHFARQSLQEYTALVASDTVNVEYQVGECNRLIHLAELELLGGPARRPQAKELLDRLQKGVAALNKDGRGGRRGQSAQATAHLLAAVLAADHDKEAAGTNADNAVKLFKSLREHRAGDKVEPANLYYEAAALALVVEMNGGAAKAPGRYKTTLATLTAALGTRRYNVKSPKDIETFRAFRVLAGDPEFAKALDAIRGPGE